MLRRFIILSAVLCTTAGCTRNSATTNADPSSEGAANTPEKTTPSAPVRGPIQMDKEQLTIDSMQARLPVPEGAVVVQAHRLVDDGHAVEVSYRLSEPLPKALATVTASLEQAGWAPVRTEANPDGSYHIDGAGYPHRLWGSRAQPEENGSALLVLLRGSQQHERE